MSNYFRGETIALVANYLNGNSSPINTGISGSMVDFYYQTQPSGAKTYYVQSGTMTQDTSYANRFFYMFDIPANAPITTYIAQYNAMYSGISVQSTDYYNIEPLPNATGIFAGSVAVSGYVVDTSGTGIQNASVQVAILNVPQILTSTVTNASGQYVIYLNAGDFTVIAGATNYLSNSIVATVPTLVTNFSFSDIVLVSSAGTGSVPISDTYTYIDQSDQLQYPLVNVKVSLYVKTGSVALTNPIAVTRTNVSGTFNLTAMNGDYVLRIEGNGPDQRVFDTSYDIEVSDAFTTIDPEGYRYLGTSQYSFI